MSINRKLTKIVVYSYSRIYFNNKKQPASHNNMDEYQKHAKQKEEEDKRVHCCMISFIKSFRADRTNV